MVIEDVTTPPPATLAPGEIPDAVTMPVSELSATSLHVMLATSCFRL